MQRVESQTFESNYGTVTLTYEGETGGKRWVWTFSDGIVRSQPGIVEMMAFKNEIEAR